MRFGSLLVASLFTFSLAAPHHVESSPIAFSASLDSPLSPSSLSIHLVRTDSLLSDLNEQHRSILERLTHVVLKVKLEEGKSELSINEQRFDLKGLRRGEGSKIQAIKAEAISLGDANELVPEGQVVSQAEMAALALQQLPEGIISTEVTITEEEVDPATLDSVNDGAARVTMKAFAVSVRVTEIDSQYVAHESSITVPVLRIELEFDDATGEPVKLRHYAIRPDVQRITLAQEDALVGEIDSAPQAQAVEQDLQEHHRHHDEEADEVEDDEDELDHLIAEYDDDSEPPRRHFDDSRRREGAPWRGRPERRPHHEHENEHQHEHEGKVDHAHRHHHYFHHHGPPPPPPAWILWIAERLGIPPPPPPHHFRHHHGPPPPPPHSRPEKEEQDRMEAFEGRPSRMGSGFGGRFSSGAIGREGQRPHPHRHDHHHDDEGAHSFGGHDFHRHHHHHHGPSVAHRFLHASHAFLYVLREAFSSHAFHLLTLLVHVAAVVFVTIRLVKRHKNNRREGALRLEEGEKAPMPGYEEKVKEAVAVEVRVEKA